jgi:hypothetical protein
MVQRRKHNRYRLEVPAIFSWKGAQEIRQQGAGLTHDLSVSGAFIFATAPPPLNSKIELNAYLPSRSAARPLRIRTQGQVVRLERARGRHRAGFAIAAEPFVVRRGGEYR